MKKTVLFFMILSCVYSSNAQTVEKGPYTVYTIDKGVYHIEDATKERPAGLKTDSEGKMVSMNNS